MRVSSLLCVSAASIAIATLLACSSSIRPPLDTGDDDGDGASRIPVITGHAEAGTDGEVDAAPPACASAPTGSCSDLGLCGGKIYAVGSSSAPPPSTGGTIAPGTYNLTQVSVNQVLGFANGTSTTNWFKQTIRISAGTAPDAGVIDAGDAGETDAGPPSTAFPIDTASESNSAPFASLTGTLLVNGSSGGIVYSCGGVSPTPPGTSYSSGTGTFVLTIPQTPGGAVVYTFALP